MNPNQPSPPIQPLPAQSATLPMEADARVIIHCPNGITVHVYRNCDNLATIIDRAYVPERKSGPPRAQICISATLLGGLAGCAAVFLMPMLKRRREPIDRSAA